MIGKNLRNVIDDFAVSFEGNDIVAYNKLLFKTFPKTLFDPNYLESSSLLNDHDIKHGRGVVHSFAYQGAELVLRHYRRGGIVAKFNHDKYFWSNLAKSRAMQEMQILNVLHKVGLPVPQPAAVRIQKNRFSYTADIVTVLIPHAKTLSTELLSESVNDDEWCRIGKIIKKFHKHNCNHSDLNAHNIMLDSQRDVYLIDFDKSEIKASPGKWQKNNLQRLKRSLEKLAHEDNGFNYRSSNFDSLMKGYGSQSE